MARYIKHTFSLLLVLALLGIFLMPGSIASADQLDVIAPVSQLVIHDPDTPEVVTKEVTVQPTYSTPQVYHETIADAAAELRAKMVARDTSIVVGLKWNSADGALMTKILDEAFRHTGNPREGDYLLRHYGGCRIQMSYIPSKDIYNLSFNYQNIHYYTTSQQEAQVDAEVNALLDQLDVWDRNDYEKVKAVYDYICNHVTYDYAGLSGTDYTTYSAWKALIKGTSVCQGYANLFYRLMLELGVDNRIISGTGNGGGHAWNIVRLGGQYYNLDATWDAEMAKWDLDYNYFLRSPGNFSDHIRNPEFDSAQFHTMYPMDDKDFSTDSVVGDVNGDMQLNDADALYLLRFTLFPTRYPLHAPGDVNGSGTVDDGDALYLLRHTLFPTRYPLYPVA